MNNRLFSLLVLPDNSTDIVGGRIHTRLLFRVAGGLGMVFLACLSIIIGYHVKLHQEESYMHSLSQRKMLIARLETAKEDIVRLGQILDSISANDRVLRLVESMDIIDDDMYQAGVGGHMIVNPAQYNMLPEQVQQRFVDIEYSLVSLGSRAHVQAVSLGEIQQRIEERTVIIDNTPSILPTYSIRVTSGFGYRIHPITGLRDYHKGVDLAGQRGQKIFAAADGVVVYAQKHYLLGNCVKIRHKYGYETIYGHLEKFAVKVGQEVKKRDIIGYMGTTGQSTGVHLHYGVMFNQRAVNPMAYFSL